MTEPEFRINIPADRCPAASSIDVAFAFRAEVPPVAKLLLIGYGDSPCTVASAARFACVSEAEARAITDRLVADGFLTVNEPEQPTPPSLARKRAIVFERDEHTCRHCGASEHLTVDHVYPKSLGGSDELDNLQTLCRSCNSRKGVSV